MDQSSEIAFEVIKNREFIHKIAAVLMQTNFSRAWLLSEKEYHSELVGFEKKKDKIILESGEGKFQSVIYTEEAPCSKAMFLADSKGDLKFQISNSGGRAWVPVKPDKPFYFAGDGNKLVVRVFAKGPAEIENMALIW